MAESINLSCFQGDNLILNIIYKDPDGNPVELSDPLGYPISLYSAEKSSEKESNLNKILSILVLIILGVFLLRR